MVKGVSVMEKKKMFAPPFFMANKALLLREHTKTKDTFSTNIDTIYRETTL